MSKIDEMHVDIKNLAVIVAEMSSDLKNMKPRCDSHGKDITEHDDILRGSGDSDGLCGRVRSMERQHKRALTVLGALSAPGIIVGFEMLREAIYRKLGWK